MAKPENNINGGGDILMLEAPPSSRPAWSTGAEVIDALPYIDEEYGDPQVKRDVDRLVEEEMARSSKKPSDFLKDLPPVPIFNLKVTFLPSVTVIFFGLVKVIMCIDNYQIYWKQKIVYI